MRSPAILRSVEWYFHTDVSGQNIGPIFKGQIVLGLFNVEDGTEKLSRNVGTELPLYAA
jgi:hypothetical protein